MKNNINALIIRKDAVLTLILTIVAMLAPLLHSQLACGTIVNAILFVAASAVGFYWSAAVAAIPSLIALSAGTLPTFYAPMVPFIILSNIILCGTFALLKKYGYWPAALSACAIKFSFLVITAQILLSNNFLQLTVPALASMMGWPQLITALLGSVVAYALLKRFNPAKIKMQN